MSLQLSIPEVTPEDVELQLSSLHLTLLRRVAPNQRLTKLLSLLESSSSRSDLSLDSAASYCGTEKNYLNTLLHNRTGFTFHSLLVRYRLYNSLKMIRSSDVTLLEIAHESGFGSLSSFERNFFRLFGQTPREYRKQKLALYNEGGNAHL